MRAFIALVAARVATGSRSVGDDVSLMQVVRLPQRASAGEEGGTPDSCTEVFEFGNSDPSNTYFNLGGLGPDADSAEEIRLSSVGTDHVTGADFDLLIKNTSAYFPQNATKNNKILNGGSWVQINNAPGATTNLAVAFVEKGTSTPLELHVTKLTLCDIDFFAHVNGKKNVSEQYVLTADAFYLTEEEPDFDISFDKATVTTTLASAADSTRFIRRISADDGVSPLRATVTATQDGDGCDNPTSPDSLEVYTYVSPPCNAKFDGRTADQAKRCLMFELDDSSGFQLDFITDEILADGQPPATAGRNLMLGAASAYFDTAEPCPTPGPTTSPPPSATPTASPTPSPTLSPTSAPTGSPTASPSMTPTDAPTSAPSMTPTGAPSGSPTAAPSMVPTGPPVSGPTPSPTPGPTSAPTGAPTAAPSMTPTSAPTGAPTAAPSMTPTGAPTGAPTAPSMTPTGAPTGVTGDPHVTNVEGQRFNLVRVGVHELLRLPRRSGSRPGQGAGGEALLEVLGTVESERKCEEPFVKQLDLNGLWLQQSGPVVLRAGGRSEDDRGAILLQVNGSHVGVDELAQDARLHGLLQVTEPPKTKRSKPRGRKAHRDKLFTLMFRFSGATLTVDWIHREVPGSSLNHLDLHVADLPKLERGIDVGGILGRDDHTSATRSSTGCTPTQSLINLGTGHVAFGSQLGAAYEQ